MRQLEVPIKLTAAVERITPDIAGAIMKNRPVNRPVSRGTVNKYIREMRAGTFESLNGETIIFNWEGGLEAGQHRLQALIDSGLPFMDVLVARGVKPGSRETHDQGRGRRASDVASDRGYKHTRVLIAATRWLWIYNKAWPSALSHNLDLTTGELVEYLEANETLATAEDDVRANYQQASKMMTGSIATFVRLVTDALDSAQSVAFFKALNSGEVTPQTRPVLKLRDRLLARSGNRTRMTAPEIIIASARVWNAIRQGREVSKLMILRDSAGGSPYRNAPRFE